MNLPSAELLMAVDDCRKWAAESGNKHWVINLGGGMFGATETEPDEAGLKADGYSLEAEVFPGGRVLWWGALRA